MWVCESVPGDRDRNELTYGEVLVVCDNGGGGGTNTVDCVTILLRYGSNPRIRDRASRFAVDYIKSTEMAQAYVEFFANVRNNPAMLSLVEKTLLWKDIDDIMSMTLREIQSQPLTAGAAFGG